MGDSWNSTGDTWNAGGTNDDSWAANNTNNANWGDGSENAAPTNGFDSGDTGHGDVSDTRAGGAGGACRNCGQDGHYARECTEPRKTGPCFNCGEEGHSKAECSKPPVFKGTCNICNEEGHPAVRCPSKPKVCARCHQKDDHDTKDCKNNFSLDLNDVAEVTETAAWSKLADANKAKDVDDFKDALRMLQKAAPGATYLSVEKKLRAEGLNNIYLIALNKDTGEGYTLVNLQGEPDRTYAVSVVKSAKCQRPNMVDKWPKSPEENLERLADSGIPMPRGTPYCRICSKFGHASRDCEEERIPVEGPTITCALCGETGHRVRDCKEERRKPREPRTCKICGSEDHLAKECDQKPKFTCRNCGGEDHKASDCTEPRKLVCNNCDKEGHISKECDQPKDWSRVTCRHCGEKGHASAARCAPGAAAKFEAANEEKNETVDTADYAADDANTGNGNWDDGAAPSSGAGWNGSASGPPTASVW